MYALVDTNVYHGDYLFKLQPPCLCKLLYFVTDMFTQTSKKFPEGSLFKKTAQ